MREQPNWQKILLTILPTIRIIINNVFVLFIRIFRSTIKTIFNQI
jgi:hypothetical protein